MVGKNIVAYGHLPSLAILDPKLNTFAKHVRLSSVSAGADTGFQPRARFFKIKKSENRNKKF